MYKYHRALLGECVLLSLHRESEHWVFRGFFFSLFNYLKWASAGLFCSARLCTANEDTYSFVPFKTSKSQRRWRKSRLFTSYFHHLFENGNICIMHSYSGQDLTPPLNLSPRSSLTLFFSWERRKYPKHRKSINAWTCYSLDDLYNGTATYIISQLTNNRCIYVLSTLDTAAMPTDFAYT